MRKTVVTITGIRPDFIRMSELFDKLDTHFEHILIHTGQHFDEMLSDVFFDELKIRKPNYNLKIGGDGKKHYHQLSDLSVKIIELLESKKINPDIILFLGDSNSVGAAFSLKKEGYKIGHIEAGMRSGDKRMLEEINRTVCDHCSDFHFCYHENYKEKLIKENLPAKNIYVVGNTIKEVCKKHFNKSTLAKENLQILLDIHRPENFKYKNRLKNIILLAEHCSDMLDCPVSMLEFPRTISYFKKYKISTKNINIISLLSYKKFLEAQFHAKMIVSDSGTAQEEAALLDTPVIVPRDFTERPESIDNHCSMMVDVNIKMDGKSWQKIKDFVSRDFSKKTTRWLGSASTSDKIIKVLKREL